MQSAATIRRKYVDFFVQHAHTHVSSAPLVPPDDPTLLFTTAGMVQFKSLYSGAVPLPYSRATTVQKCLRAGGKGSDLENVGKTLRHHTFFEMLGNFSFGDYFKRDAIVWAWDFCTNPAWLGLPGERIFPTVFGKPDGKGGWLVDDEAEAIWKNETGVPNGIVRLNEKENFWGPAGESGACGPCSEIKFFMGTEAELKEYQRLSHSSDPADQAKLAYDIVELGDLFLEIWNLVFPQYDQQPDGSRLPLKNRGIDTGAGLERVTTAVNFWESQGKINSPYETDMMQPLVRIIAELAQLPYPALVGGEEAIATLTAKGLDPAVVRLAMNACADHARALTFCLSEGIVPSNEGRGYVLRRILRRAARFGKKIGISEPFLWRLVQPVVQLMGEVYPDIAGHPDMVEKTIRAEEERFNRTLNQGGERLEQLLAALKPGDTLSGEKAYLLFDTYGYPLDLTIEAAEEHGLAVDTAEYEKCLAEGKARARASWKGGAGAGKWVELLNQLTEKDKTEFLGYKTLNASGRVLALISGEQKVEQLEEGQAGVVVLDRTPFYAESGGQIGDQGVLTLGDETVFIVEDTQKSDAGFVLHFGEARGAIALGTELKACVDAARRHATMANHSATHLMQGALKRIIGGHVTQQGSSVGPDGLRFDFTNPEPIGEARLHEIERLVNAQVVANLPVCTAEMSLEEARQTGAIAPFGEKYGSRVRVISMGADDSLFSREFCGGTHVSATGEIGLFVITSESSVASGIRRLEARTALGAWAQVAQERQLLAGLARRLSAPVEAIDTRIATLQDEIKTLRRQVEEARIEKTRAQMTQAAADSLAINGVQVIIQRLDGADANLLAQAWDSLKQKSAAATLGVFCGTAEGKVNLVVGVTDDIAGKRVKAGDVLNALAGLVGGKGGGRPNLARGGGSEPEKLDEALAQLPQLLTSLIH
jgi:alanyl-tRNA synthetase